MDHLRWMAQPTLHRPTIIAAFTGWNDAGDAASNSVRHLIEAWNAQPLAEIDPEEFTDFATVRPHVRLTNNLTRHIVWPTVGLWHASTPGCDVILVLGPEPAMRWRTFSEQIIGVAKQYNASLVLTLGALLADVPHTRDAPVTGSATDPDLIEQLGHWVGEGGQVGCRACQDMCLESRKLGFLGAPRSGSDQRPDRHCHPHKHPQRAHVLELRDRERVVGRNEEPVDEQ